MRLRCIVFVPPAALVTGGIFLLTSSIVSALESTFATPEPVAHYEIVRFETECEALEEQTAELARFVDSCEALPGCLESQNICPSAMREELAEEYNRLRLEVQSRCTGLPVYATPVSASCALPAEDCSQGSCDAADADWEGASGIDAPNVFLF